LGEKGACYNQIAMELSRHYWFADLLTFAGMLGIFICHLSHVLAGFYIIDYQSFPLDFPYGLEVMVILFFILSGFKIASTLEGSTSSRPFSYSRYLLRRFLTLWPLFMLALVSYLVFRYFLRVEEWNSLNAWSYLEQIFLLQGFDPSDVGAVVPGSWFIGCLWIFYIVAPLIARFFAKSHRLVYLLAVAVLIRFLFFLTLNQPWFGVEAEIWNVYVKHCYLSNFPYFVLGMLVYRLCAARDFAFKSWDLLPLAVVMIYHACSDDMYDNYALLFALLLVAGTFLPSWRCRFLSTLSKGALGSFLFQMLFLRTLALYYPYPETMEDGSRYWLSFVIIFPGLGLLSVGLYYGISYPLLSLSDQRLTRDRS
jgi:peptidoglycan/LPS O-acetylase OafA/YrhL